MAQRGVNKVILLGNLGNDPDVRTMNNGESVATFSVATGETWKDKNGQIQEKTEWHRVVFYRKIAELAAQYLHKGSKVYIEGRLQTRQYEKDGVNHYTTEIIGIEMRLLDRNPENEQDTTQYGKPQASKPSSKPPIRQQSHRPQPVLEPDYDDDIPF